MYLLQQPLLTILQFKLNSLELDFNLISLHTQTWGSLTFGRMGALCGLCRCGLWRAEYPAVYHKKKFARATLEPVTAQSDKKSICKHLLIST
jgi:hypothetical protein